MLPASNIVASRTPYLYINLSPVFSRFIALFMLAMMNSSGISDHHAKLSEMILSHYFF